MNRGEMRHRIKYLMPLKGRHDDTNEEVTTWLTSNELWAKVEYLPQGSDEKEVGDRKTAFTSTKITTNYRAAIRPTWKVVLIEESDRERTFNVLSVLEDSHRVFSILECEQTEKHHTDYFAVPGSGFWIDENGNFWVADGDTTDPTPYGDLTWTDPDGNSWSTSN